MKAFTEEFLRRIGAKEEAVAALLDATDKLSPFEATMREIDGVIRETKRIEPTEEARRKVAENAGVPYETVNALAVIRAGRWLKEDYLRAGIAEDIFWDSMTDLRCKLEECISCRGVWGTFVEFWYDGFFRMDIFRLGRLEFERLVYHDVPTSAGGVEVKDGDIVYSVHIPASGEPLTKEARLDSYRRALKFFAPELPDGRIMFLCASWLLYLGNAEIFPPHLNVSDFMHDWKIFKSYETEKFSDDWRVFGKHYEDLSELPEKTTMQKAMAAHLRAGKKTGVGFGLMLFDGKTMITK